MSVSLIDPDGSELTTGWRLNELRELSGLADAPLYDYLCRNMGYVFFRIEPHSLTVRLNPAIVSTSTLAAAFYKTAEYSETPVKAEFLGRGPVQIHALSDGASAIDFISRIVKLRSVTESGRFFRKRAPAGLELANGRFKRLLELLKRFPEPDDNDFVKAHLKRHFAGRYVVMNSSVDAGRLILADAGSGYTGLSSQWAKDALGKPVDKLYDRAYWSFVSEAFEETVRSGIPTLDDIEAVVRTSPGQSSALSYQRLIVPLSNGRVLGVSVRSRAPLALGS